MRILLYLFNIIKSPQRKHLFRWIYSFKKNYLLEAHIPWLTFDAIDYILSHLPPRPKIFEYGSGGSTLLWQDLNSTCVSIEHDQEWFRTVSLYLKKNPDTTYKLIPPVKSHVQASSDYSDPNLYLSTDPKFKGYNFRDYVTFIDNFPKEYFDLVIIDGRARPSCILHSTSRVKKGGMLVLDNSDRDYYLSKTFSYLKPFKCKKFTGITPVVAYATQTSIYIY